MDIIARSAIVGGVAAAGVSFLFPSTETIPVFGMELSQAVGVGVVVAGSSAVGSVAGRYILPMIQPDGLAQTESKILNPALTGAATYAVASMFGSVPAPFPLVALGAASEVAGSYVYETVSPMMMGRKTGSKGLAASTI